MITVSLAVIQLTLECEDCGHRWTTIDATSFGIDEACDGADDNFECPECHLRGLHAAMAELADTVPPRDRVSRHIYLDQVPGSDKAGDELSMRAGATLAWQRYVSIPNVPAFLDLFKQLPAANAARDQR